MLRDTSFPRLRKHFLRILALALCGFAGATFADDFKSVTFDAAHSPVPIRVHGDQFMVIRNFTQENAGSTRGFVQVAKPDATSGMLVRVLAAAILSMPTVEVINSVVIAGPAD